MASMANRSKSRAAFGPTARRGAESKAELANRSNLRQFTRKAPRK